MPATAEETMMREAIASGTPTPETQPATAAPTVAPPTAVPQPAQPEGAAYTASEAPTFAPREVAPGETVESRLTGLLSKDSPYISQARQGAAETAQGRGLLNTTIAAGAGEREAIRAALPIATADAATAARAAESAQQAEQLATTEGYRGEITSVAREQQAGLESGLSKQEHQQRLDLEAKAQELTGDRADQKTYVELASGIQQQYQSEYLKIQQTADTIMDAGAKLVAIEALNKSTLSQQNMLSAIYGVDATWVDGITRVVTEEAA